MRGFYSLIPGEPAGPACIRVFPATCTPEPAARRQISLASASCPIGPLLTSYEAVLDRCSELIHLPSAPGPSHEPQELPWLGSAGELRSGVNPQPMGLAGG